MIITFIKKNKRAIINGLKWMSLIFTSIVLIIFLIGLFNKQYPTIGLFIIVILTAGIGLPILGILVGFLRWWWDYSVTKRCYNSFPFNKLDTIGFRKMIKNENSKSKFISEYLTGTISDYIVDCDVDTQNDHKNIRFKYFVNRKPLNKSDFKRIQKNLNKQNGYMDIDWISKKYHYKNHLLKSVAELERDLNEFAKLIKKENIEPLNIARR